MPDAQTPTSSPLATNTSPSDEIAGTQTGGGGVDPLSHLYKMSTTSAGGGEYVAINATSIVALLLGVASVVALMTDVLLIVPLAGLICGIVAIVQIRRSNGTQSGMAFAAIGVLLSLLIGGARAGQQVASSNHNARDAQTMAAMIERFGQDVHAGRYNELYEDEMSKAFRDDVDRATFAANLENMQKVLGQIDSIQWNGIKPYLEEVGTSGVHTAYAVGLMKFHNKPNPGRPEFTFSDREGTWKIDQMSFFPERKKKKKEL
jgi:hypothetical protein